MKVEILRPFFCSLPGGGRDMKPGDIVEIPDRTAGYLVDDGYLKIVDIDVPGRVAAGLIARELVEVPISRTFDKIAAGLNDAIAIARGEAEPAHVHVSAVPSALSVRDLGKGWFAVFRDGEKLTKSVRSKIEAEAEMAKLAN